MTRRAWHAPPSWAERCAAWRRPIPESGVSSRPRPAACSKEQHDRPARTTPRSWRSRAASDVGADLTGATVWVTLEPCAHTGRTGPCADALIEAGVGRVVVGLEDPDPHVAGAGLPRLRDAGIAVEVGEGADEVRDDLASYITHRTHGRPFVTLKLAVTIDGQAIPKDPATQWITGPEARADGHRLRAQHDAILVGAGTVRADNPRLTTRDAEGPDPIRVVLGHRRTGRGRAAVSRTVR